MTSLPGGAANRAGIRYEHWWAVWRIIDVLEGRITSLKIEPQGNSWEGIDVVVEGPQDLYSEQVKNAQSITNWTISRLQSKKILQTVKIQISNGRSFRFVTSTPATQLSNLVDRARKSETLTEFEELLSDSLAVNFDQLNSAWNIPREQTWQWLKYIEIKHLTVDSIFEVINSNLRRIYAKDAEIIIALLRDYCDDSLNESLTAPKIRAYLESKGIKPLSVDDPDVIDQLHSTVERHKDRINSWIPIKGLVTRNIGCKIFELLRVKERNQLAESNRQVVVLDGQAGYGKSTVVAEVAQRFEQEGWFVAIVRMDMIKNTVSTSIELGRASRIEGSPGLLLARVANGNPALLIFDQLDAVSTYSGRMSDNFDAVVESLRELSSTPNVKSMLVVRTADLEGNPRLSRLADEHLRCTVDALTIEDVREYFRKSNMPIPESGTLHLLQVPLHLAVFTKLSESTQRNSFRTLQDLYAEYTRHVRRNLEKRSSGFPWSKLIETLVSNMNENEMLSAPEGILDCLSQAEIDVAVSESVITRNNDRVSFFHESYFDYLFARAFIGSGNDLHSFLVNTGQYLFQRTQTRQILEYLVANDRAKFRNVVVELLVSKEIRTHLKGVVVSVLAQIDPEQEDWDALETIAWSDASISSKVLALLNRTSWFDAADARWEQWLDDPIRVESAFAALVSVADQRPERVEQLMHPYVGKPGEWEDRLRQLILLKGAGLVDLSVDLIDRGYFDFFLNSDNTNDTNFWFLIYSMKDRPIEASRLIGTFLNRGLYCAQLDRSSDPFKSNHLSSHGHDGALIIEIADAAPIEFIDSLLSFVVTVAYADQIYSDSKLPIGMRWGIYPQRGFKFPNSGDVTYSIDDAVFLGVELAFRKIASKHFNECDLLLRSLQSAESKELRYLVCRALTVCGLPDRAIEWLLEDERNMYLDQASQEMIEVCSLDCSDDLFMILENTILSTWPSGELGSSSAGCTQYGLLSKLCQSRMSGKAQKRLNELKRKFPEPSVSPTPPRGVAVPVGSPIGYEAVQHMSDGDWLRALHKYRSNDLRWEGDKSIGGARELAQQLGNRAVEKPERFAHLALRFDNRVPSVAIENIISEIVLKIDVDLFMKVCNHARDLYGVVDVGRQICWSLQRLQLVTGDIVEILTECSLVPYEKDELNWLQNHPNSSLGLHTIGMNSTRGAAALAISSILFHNKRINETYLENFQAMILRLVTDPILAVRACAADSVRALLNHMPDQGLDMAETLFDSDLDVLVDEAAMHLLWSSIFRDPERFGDTLVYALNGSDQVAQQAGRVWAAASLHDTLPSHAVCDVSRLPLRARCGAAEEFASHPVESRAYLEVLLNDGNPGVRDQAIRVVRYLDMLNTNDLNSVTDIIVSSAAFNEHFDTLINKLARLTVILPTATVDACHRAVELAGSELADMRTRHAVTAHSLTKIILRLYRQSRFEERIKCLDLIDKLTELNVFGLSESLEHER